MLRALACVAVLFLLASASAGAQEESPRDYLYDTYPDIAPRMDCVIAHESRWFPGATNPASGAAGLAQFIWSTWNGTPQGQAGLSPYDPYAAIDGAAWLATYVGWSQWLVVTRGLC